MTEPLRYPTVRWQCPYCLRGRSKYEAAREHIARCYQNPAARGCLTCEHRIEPSGDGWIEPVSSEDCAKRIPLPKKGLPVGCHHWAPDDWSSRRILPHLDPPLYP